MSNRSTNDYNSRSTGGWVTTNRRVTVSRRAANNLTDADFAKQLTDIIDDAIRIADERSITRLLNNKDKIEKFCNKNTSDGRRLQTKVLALHTELRECILHDLGENRRAQKSYTQSAEYYISAI